MLFFYFCLFCFEVFVWGREGKNPQHSAYSNRPVEGGLQKEWPTDRPVARSLPKNIRQSQGYFCVHIFIFDFFRFRQNQPQGPVTKKKCQRQQKGTPPKSDPNKIKFIFQSTSTVARINMLNSSWEIQFLVRKAFFGGGRGVWERFNF